MKIFLFLLTACPLLFGEAVDMPGQNPGNNSAALPGINPDDSIFPTPATPPTKAVVPSAPPPRPLRLLKSSSYYFEREARQFHPTLIGK